LFFALWPDEATRAALARLSLSLHEHCGGRRVPERNIHLTLVFLGDLPADRLPSLLEMAGAAREAAVDLILDTVEYWRRNRLVCVGAQACPPALRELCAHLAAGARGLGLHTETRDYVPHVTLLRKAERAPSQREAGPIEWRASEFLLVRSELNREAAAYETVGRWRLANRSD
jgi:2'-5' RNA ligase